MPETGQVMEFACRVCNACLATRRHQWLARAMAEKASWPFALAVTLTYNDETESNRDGAAMFRYSDVRAFVKRLLSAARYKAKTEDLGFVPRVRFICAGEQGSRHGRCHWHLVLFSDVDPCLLGDVSRKSGPVLLRQDMISPERESGGTEVKRLAWSMWEHGFCVMQEPDAEGLAYVLKYCLKDQFTVEKSVGTAREHKAEAFATGLFRMSKTPAIGEAWFWHKMERLLSTGSVLPALKLRVPDMRNYWVPSGLTRKRLLWALAAINRMVLWDTGQNAPQWGALLASVADSPYDRRVLDGEAWFEEKRKDTERLGSLGRLGNDDYFLAKAREVRLRGWIIRCRFCCGEREFQAGFETGSWSTFESASGFKLWSFKSPSCGRSSKPAESVARYARCEGCGDTRHLIAIPQECYRPSGTGSR